MSLQPYYDDGTCVIYHGDCREVLPTLSAVEAVITDPPYGIAWDSAHYGNPDAAFGKPIANDADTSCRDWLIEQCVTLPILCFGSLRAQMPPHLRQVLVFHKDCFHAGLVGARLPWLRDWEPIFACGTWPNNGSPRLSSVIATREVAAAGYSGYTTRARHPHAKPLDVMRALIDAIPPGLICDPFLGSGTTLRAAKDRGRKAIGIEIEEKYCEIAARRLGQEVLPLEAS